MRSKHGNSQQPLDGIRVLDASNLIAGPLASTFLADYGAEVIKIEHPVGGDALRNHGETKDGEPLWWKYLGRSKQSVTLDLGAGPGQDVFRSMAVQADVVIENFRPGTMTRWGLDYETLRSANDGLVMAHVTGFGQFGPLSGRPGFGTIGESMSGFAHRNGHPDGSPTLPPFGLADTVTGMIGAYSIMVALWERNRSGVGQEIDLALIESLLPVLEPQIVEYDQLGRSMSRMGNQSPMNAPRNLYPTADEKWVAVSTSTTSTAERLLRLVGRTDITHHAWFATAGGRAQHAAELNEIVGAWIAAREQSEVIAACEAAGTPCAGVYSAADIVEDPQYKALGSIVTVDDDVLGPVRMPNVSFRLSRTPGAVRWAGPPLGEHTDAVLGRLGYDAAQRDQLREQGVI